MPLTSLVSWVGPALRRDGQIPARICDAPAKMSGTESCCCDRQEKLDEIWSASVIFNEPKRWRFEKYDEEQIVTLSASNVRRTSLTFLKSM